MTRIQIRRDTAAAWTASNPTLASGEQALETDTRKRKTGDGATAWTALGYEAGDASLLTSGTLADARLSSPVTVSLSKADTAVQPAGLTKTAVGLGNVDNTADTAKPVSTAQATALAAKADLVAGLVPTSQIPALALTTAVPVASQAAMLALTTTQVQPGDLAVRSDGAGTFILTAADPSVLANWTRLNAPTDAVTSVNGQVGTVSLAAADVGAPPTTRAITAGTGLTGGGTLAADTSLAVAYGTAAGTAAQGNDTRLGTVNGIPVIGTPTAGQVPTASSGTAAAWATPAGGSISLPAVSSGNWYCTFGANKNNFSTPSTSANGTVVYGLFMIPVLTTFNQVSLHLNAAGSIGSLIRLGLWSDAGGLPGALVLDAGTIDGTVAGYGTIAINLKVPAGVYWGGQVQQGAPATLTSQYFTRGVAMTVTQDDQYSPTSGFSSTGVTGALASNPVVTPYNNTTGIRLKVA